MLGLAAPPCSCVVPWASNRLAMGIFMVPDGAVLFRLNAVVYECSILLRRLKWMRRSFESRKWLSGGTYTLRQKQKLVVAVMIERRLDL